MRLIKERKLIIKIFDHLHENKSLKFVFLLKNFFSIIPKKKKMVAYLVSIRIKLRQRGTKKTENNLDVQNGCLTEVRISYLDTKIILKL